MSRKLFPAALAAGFVTSVSASAAPSVMLTPKVNHPSSQVNVTGAGFGANKLIDLYWDATDELLAVSDSGGGFSKSIPVPVDALPGTHWVSAGERGSGDGAQASFTVRTDWVEHGFGAHGRRNNPYENVISPANAANLDVAWTYSTGANVNSSPAVVGGVVYIGSNDGYLYALNAATGALKWRRNVGGVDYSSPAVANGLVYVGSMLGKIYALNPGTGSVKWVYPASGNFGFNVEGSPTVVGNAVYIGADNGSLYALNASTGAELWQLQTTYAYQMWSAPAVSNGVLYVGSGDNNLYAIDTASGAKLWSTATTNSVLSSPAVAQGWVFFGSYNNYFFAEQVDDVTRPSYLTGNEILSSPAVANGNVYFGSADGYLYSLKLLNRRFQLNWQISVGDAPGSVYSSPAVANGVVYSAASDQYECCYISALDADSGSLLWQELVLGTTLNASPAVANGMVYIGTDSGKVYAFALDAGANAVYRRPRVRPTFASLHPDMRLRPAR